jgi:hypothetical protein
MTKKMEKKMSTEITTIEIDPALRALIQGHGPVDNSALSEGISSSFPVMSFRGKVWRVRYNGEATPILMDGDPVPAILCVIVYANPKLSKLFYTGAYEEGGSDAPTCFSLDGVAPDPTAEAPQSKTCAVCPHNVWGSKITPQGTKTKACSDSRRVAVVPYPDLDNELYGGPMLLRIPPASFRELLRYSAHLTDAGLPFSAVVTRIGFDIEAAFPKLVMREVRALSPEEYEKVIGMRSMETVERMLSVSEAELADVAPDPGPLSEAAAATGPAAAAPDTQKAAQTAAEEEAALEAAAVAEVEAEDQAAAEAASAATAKAAKVAAAKAKAKSAKEAKAAAAAEPEAPATATEAAAATGVNVPAELASLLGSFST